MIGDSAAQPRPADEVWCGRSYTGYKDELAWAALWLHQATGDKQYLDKALDMYHDCCAFTDGGPFGWDNKGG
jgi:uncharacterized protein YyaL (SSP411 family)